MASASSPSPSDGFERVAAADRVEQGHMLAVVVAGTELLLTRRTDGTVVAFPPGCPHQGQPLGGGAITGDMLECPHHFYAYDLCSGANLHPGDDDNIRLLLHEVHEVDDGIYLRPPG